MDSRFPEFQKRFTELCGDFHDNTAFANAIGLTRQSIRSYMNGARIPDCKLLKQIAENAHVSADWLLGLSDVKQIDGDLQAASDYTGLSDSSLETIQKWTSKSRTYKNILNGIFSYIASDENFLKGLFQLCCIAQMAIPFSKEDELTEEEKESEKKIKQKVDDLLKEMPPHRKNFLVEGDKYVEYIKYREVFLFDALMDFLVRSATSDNCMPSDSEENFIYEELPAEYYSSLMDEMENNTQD